MMERKTSASTDVRKRNEKTYSNNGRIIGHRWGLCFLDTGVLFDSQVFDVAAPEHNVLVHLVRGCYFICRLSPPTFRAEGTDIFEGDGRFV